MRKKSAGLADQRRLRPLSRPSRDERRCTSSVEHALSSFVEVARSYSNTIWEAAAVRSISVHALLFSCGRVRTVALVLQIHPESDLRRPPPLPRTPFEPSRVVAVSESCRGGPLQPITRIQIPRPKWAAWTQALTRRGRRAGKSERGTPSLRRTGPVPGQWRWRSLARLWWCGAPMPSP